jgi:diguanylate cyclase (GGDEF)-like protein/PAS domain S-box-containing protein
MVEEHKKTASSNTRYEEYLNLAGSMILALDKNGVITYINKKGCEILGFCESEIIGKTWIENFIPKQSHDEIEEIRKAVMSLKPGDRDYKEGQVIASDGRIKWISWSNSGMFDDEGRLIGTLSSGEDITEKKENEKKLLENENRLKDSEAMSHTGHWVRDLKSGKYIFSDEMYRIFGLDRRIKLIYADFLHDKFHPDDAQKIIEYTEKCLKEGKDYTFEGRLLLPDNKIKHIKASVKINKDKNGNPISAKGVMSDVTETVLFEQELIRNELQLKKAEEIAKVGSFIQDLRTNEYICSDGFLNICGFADSGSKVDFTKAMGVTHPDDSDYIQEIIAESLKTGSDYEFENRIIRPDGEVRYVRSKGTYIKNESGEPIKSMGTLLDITDYKKNENRLLESQRRLKMAEKIAHIGHWERDYETGVSFWSDEVYRILGCEPQGFVASEKEYVNYIHPDDYEKFEEDSQKAVSGEIPYDIESRIIDSKGAVKFIRIIGNRILKNGELNKTFGTIEDVTSDKLYENELIKRTRTLENAEAIAHIGHWERDFNNDSMYWSDEIYRIIGFEPDDFEVYPNKDREFIHPDDWDELQKYYMKTRNDGTPFEIDVRAYKRTGEEIVIKIKGGVTSGENEGLVISGTIEDITELKKHYDEIEYMNYHDPLTGLFNRRYFDEQFGKIDNNENYPISVIIADVNGLKMINDTLGHNTGDEILKKTAEILANAAEEGDILARIGGDDFALLLPRTIKSQAELVINEVHKLFVEQEEEMGVSISMGLAIKFDSFQRKEDIIKEAEDNMYTNKLYEKSSKRGDLLRLIMDALYERSSREELHSERVSKYCSDLGKRLKLPKHKINELSALGLLHDIGKIAVRDSVLNKPGPLDDDEWDEVKRHPETGYRLLSKAPGMQEASKYILSHHERWDGNGYPQGLSTYDIPLQARIIAIADAFDAMRSKRPYRDPLPLDIAVSEMKKGAGSQFDPDLAKVFIIEVLGKEW